MVDQILHRILWGMWMVERTGLLTGLVSASRSVSIHWQTCYLGMAMLVTCHVWLLTSACSSDSDSKGVDRSYLSPQFSEWSKESRTLWTNPPPAEGSSARRDGGESCLLTTSTALPGAAATELTSWKVGLPVTRKWRSVEKVLPCTCGHAL